MVANLTCSLIIYEKVETTLAKAKELQSYFDKIMTVAKKNTPSAKRIVFKRLNQNQLATDKVFDVYLDMLKDVDSGYTARYLLGERKGDSSKMAKVEIIKNRQKQK